MFSLRSRLLPTTTQTGVLCMAVHTLASGGRFLIVSGGDDQAICVAEVEVLHGHSPELSDAERSPQSSPTDYVERNENKPSRNRYAKTLATVDERSCSSILQTKQQLEETRNEQHGDGALATISIGTTNVPSDCPESQPGGGKCHACKLKATSTVFDRWTHLSVPGTVFLTHATQKRRYSCGTLHCAV